MNHLSFLSISILLVVTFSANAYGKLQCKAPLVEIPKDWIDMKHPCVKKVQEQVQEELIASMTYFAMGAHFSKDVVNRPGFAKFFFDSASEEREHAIKLLDYLLMRGQLTNEVAQLIRDPAPLAQSWPNALDALKVALKLEATVTRKLIDIAKVCENPGQEGENWNDYHIVDWVTTEYLDEQYKGQRALAGMITNLGKMVDKNGHLGEHLFDKSLLFGDDFVKNSLTQ